MTRRTARKGGKGLPVVWGRCEWRMQFKTQMLHGPLLCGVLLSGCRSPAVPDGADVASSRAPVPAVNTGAQWYAPRVTKSDLWRMTLQHGGKFYEPWQYMGSQDGEHYLTIYPLLGFREVYRIAADAYPIEAPFTLTAQASKWRAITQMTHLGIEQPFIIEPQLFEQPAGLVPNPVSPNQQTGLGSDVETLLLQEVLILQDE
jgi:hypothetical protein